MCIIKKNPKLKYPLISVNIEDIKLMHICTLKFTKSEQFHIFLPNLYNLFSEHSYSFYTSSITLLGNLPKHYHITENYRLVSHMSTNGETRHKAVQTGQMALLNQCVLETLR